MFIITGADEVQRLIDIAIGEISYVIGRSRRIVRYTLVTDGQGSQNRSAMVVWGYGLSLGIPKESNLSGEHEIS